MNNRRNGLPETGISYAAAVAKIIRPNPCRCSPAQVSARALCELPSCWKGTTWQLFYIFGHSTWHTN
jgi:hypothetical protein